jgi:hypothetical protein
LRDDNGRRLRDDNGRRLRDDNGRRVPTVRTRQVRGISEDVRLNKALWTLAEKMAELKAS